MDRCLIESDLLGVLVFVGSTGRVFGAAPRRRTRTGCGRGRLDRETGGRRTAHRLQDGRLVDHIRPPELGRLAGGDGRLDNGELDPVGVGLLAGNPQDGLGWWRPHEALHHPPRRLGGVKAAGRIRRAGRERLLPQHVLAGLQAQLRREPLGPSRVPAGHSDKPGHLRAGWPGSPAGRCWRWTALPADRFHAAPPRPATATNPTARSPRRRPPCPSPALVGAAVHRATPGGLRWSPSSVGLPDHCGSCLPVPPDLPARALKD
jgi:hypothetical protein